MSLLDYFDNESKNKLTKESINQGNVYLKDFDEATHKKLFIIAGTDKQKLLICSVFINSEIHPAIFNKPKQLNLQVFIKKLNNNFLKHDSFANCAYPIKLDGEEISKQIQDGTCKYKGMINMSDLLEIQKVLINSNLLSEEEIELYFK